jgi:hypothetical protein
MNADEHIHGLMAEFSRDEEILSAARQAFDQGYRQMDAFTPFPIDGLAETLGRKKSRVPLIVLLAGIAGGTGGYFMEWYAMVKSYPIEVGGRPLNSWPAYIPITFELTILCAAVAAVLAMFILNRLPEPYHPVFNVPEFRRASTDKFFLCIDVTDRKFDLKETGDFLRSLKAEGVWEVPK